MIEAKVIEDSINEQGERITTMQLKYQRFVHSEFMTHRTFCLDGDARLDFDLPAGNGKKTSRRVHSMSIRDFVTKWHEGVRPHAVSRHNGAFLNELEDGSEYTAKQVATRLGHKRCLNLNHACRKGLVLGAYKANEKKGAQWRATGSAWKAWRQATGERVFSIKTKLAKMHLRQVNEATGEITTAKVADCCYSGIKPVFNVAAKGFSVTASADHRILTESGWKTVKELQPGIDKVLTYKLGAESSQEKFKKIDGRWVSTWARKIRKQVAERQVGKCSFTGEDLQDDFDIHHVLPKHLRPDLAFSLDNVVAVNKKAHKQLHRKQGWQKGVHLGTQWAVVESITYLGDRDTYDLEMCGEWANFFANGVVVHNSRNASSTRAIPTSKLIEQVRNDPAMPVEWGKNQPGMQARELIAQEDVEYVESSWKLAASLAADSAEALMAHGVHKQIAGRCLEPFTWIHVVVTATDWDNFFALRDHKDAQPEIATLARSMRLAMLMSKPRLLLEGEWHLPYVLEEERLGLRLQDQIACSVARCARVSYLKHDQTAPSIEDDLLLHDRLVLATPPHMSPAEHQATPTNAKDMEANLRGWMQYRKVIELGETL